MLALPLPRSLELLAPGQVFFSMGEGFVSHNIATETGRELYQAGLLVATHCGVVLEDGYVAEAWYPRFRIVPLRERLEKRAPLIWLKTPAGQTRESAAELCRRARELEGVEYDTWGVVGFTLSDQDDVGQHENRLNNPAKYFCSEAVDSLLRDTEHLRTVALPKAWKLVHSSWRSPQGLNVSPIWG